MISLFLHWLFVNRCAWHQSPFSEWSSSLQVRSSSRNGPFQGWASTHDRCWRCGVPVYRVDVAEPGGRPVPLCWPSRTRQWPTSLLLSQPLTPSNLRSRYLFQPSSPLRRSGRLPLQTQYCTGSTKSKRVSKEKNMKRNKCVFRQFLDIKTNVIFGYNFNSRELGTCARPWL